MADKEPFEITAVEADKLTKALKDDEFRKLLFEYAQEISNPENKKRYEDDLIQLEKQRGVDMKFLKPNPGFVLRLYILPEGSKKVFVNICHSESVNPATSKLVKNKEGQSGENWSIPYSLTMPREEVDKDKKQCSVVDAIFHPDAFQRGQQHSSFQQLLIETALEGIEENLDLKLDKKRMTMLKKITYKGTPSSTVIRTVGKDAVNQKNVDLGDLPLKVPYPPLNQTSDKVGPTLKTKHPTEPKYTIVYSGEFSMQDFTNERKSTLVKRPKNLIVTVKLPGVKSASCADLNVFERQLTLECGDPLYKLDLALSYPVDNEKGKAKFDKASMTLTVTLPILPPTEQPEVIEIPMPLVSEIVSEPVTKREGDEKHSEDESVQPAVNSSPEETMSTDDPGNLDSVEESRRGELTDEWASVGDWSCPPFSYRQDDSSVTFVLYTPNVNEQSLVSTFDKNQVQLTFKTGARRSYSFFVSFGDDCDIESDDCVVDVSDNNVVILLTKDKGGIWEKFSVGLNASQTTEKLFLTEANVQSALEEIEQLPDPWVQSSGLSDSAQVKVVSASETHLDVHVVEQSPPPETSFGANPAPISADTRTERTAEENRPKPGSNQSTPKLAEYNPPPAKSNPTNQTSAVNEKQPDERPDQTPSKGCLDKSDPVHNEPSSGCRPSGNDLLKHFQETHIECTDPHLEVRNEMIKIDSGIVDSSQATKGNSFVQVEKDGSMFVRADADYVQSRSKGKLVLESIQNSPKEGVQFSNKLIYSLD